MQIVVVFLSGKMTKTSTGTTRETAVSFWYKGEIERERERNRDR